MNYKREVNVGQPIWSACGLHGVISAELQPGEQNQNGDKKRFFSVAFDEGNIRSISEADIKAYFFDKKTT